ncbi:MAG: hypothetical protein A2X18_02525 [Bacteroidetes bacterium GWF2_40_14]|nr:MAG: hypothetical protein A2X18_02525 [Bacteroidetes bacterium GWF2_40_14]
MKDENINRFFKDHRQTIADDGFSERLFAHLDCIPAPAPRVDRSRLIISVFALIGLLLFIILGGYSSLIIGLGSMGSLFEGLSSIRPEVIVAVVFMGASLFAVGKFAIEEK